MLKIRHIAKPKTVSGNAITPINRQILTKNLTRMKNLFDKKCTTEIISRIHNLTPTSQRLWGKMEVDQMLAHCRKTLEMATGDKVLPRVLIGKLIGLFLSKNYLAKSLLGKMARQIKHLKSKTEEILKSKNKN